MMLAGQNDGVLFHEFQEENFTNLPGVSSLSFVLVAQVVTCGRISGSAS